MVGLTVWLSRGRFSFFEALAGGAEGVARVYPVRFEPVGVQLGLGFVGIARSEPDSS
ncbi:hypothetical protein F3Y22_tig00117022pilonHSYRG00043 [Hibiscus syriacus]|uniref:Uncharacterized protein n=1 Tax=Hibiscus syriacus TaxID=106335 RepID=A0A6A2XGU4_HIBSY|nr:hypothetical protein F3Y22_tig00117022pilonHSYRG00043 [Hibiscus syriacus]